MRKIILAGLITLVAMTAVQAEWWQSSPPPIARGHQMPDSWWEAAKRASVQHGTNPFVLAAVGWVESNWKAGSLGKTYVGPMGFHRACKIPWEDMHIPEKQIERTARLLAGNTVARLKRYNPAGGDAYPRKILVVARGFEQKAWSIQKLFAKPPEACYKVKVAPLKRP